MQLHRLTGTDAPSRPGRRDVRHRTRNRRYVPDLRAQSAVERLPRRGAGKAGGTRGESRLGGIARALSVAAWLVASCITLGLTSLGTTAQAEVLVSNIAQSRASTGVIVSSAGTAAQGFTTGTSATGYELTSIDIYVHTAPPNTAEVTVSVYTSSSGDPGTSVHTLTNPDTITAGQNTFTAPSEAFLAAKTPYFVVAESTHGFFIFRLSQTSSDTEGSNVGGWSIANVRRWKGSAGWISNNDAHLITVKAEA